MNKCLKLLFAWFFILGCIGTALAQSSTGSLSVTAMDEKQSVIPGANVTIRNVDTGFARNGTADNEGRVKFVNLPIGAYEVTVESAGFAKYVQTGITLTVNQDAVVEAMMKAGGVAEVVT